MEIDTIVCRDCLDVMREMPDECVDLVLTDPPYGVSDEDWDVFEDGWVIETWRVLRQGGQWYSFITHHNLCALQGALPVLPSNILIWIKPFVLMRKGLRRWLDAAEFVIYAQKGKPTTWNRPDGTEQFNWCKTPSLIHKRRTIIHPHQKPISLIRRYILASSDDGDLVFDPFMGSGTTAVAALKLGRRFYGCDINPEYVEMANKRIEKAKLEMSQMEMKGIL